MKQKETRKYIQSNPVYLYISLENFPDIISSF